VASELCTMLASPDPGIRDDTAYPILAIWTGRRTREPTRDMWPGGLPCSGWFWAVYPAEIRARSSFRSFSILVIRVSALAWVPGFSSSGAAFQ
jgi:hypothetical protein